MPKLLFLFIKNIIIVDNLNEDLNNMNFHHLTDILSINSLINTINSQTRQQAILDLIIIPDDMLFLNSGTSDNPDNVSDHKTTYIRVISLKYLRHIEVHVILLILDLYGYIKEQILPC